MVNAGANVTFNVAATGTEPFSYQWQFNGADLTDGGRVSGTKTATLSITCRWSRHRAEEIVKTSCSE
jgi:hypothetical protein